MTRYEFKIDEKGRKKRIDDFLFDRFSEVGKKYLRQVLKEEKCVVNGFVANAGTRLKRHDFVELEIDVSSAKKIIPEKIALDIIFEDSHIIVVNKPAGMLVHPTPKHRSGTLLNALTYHLNSKLIEKHDADSSGNLGLSNLIRPGLVHRLDKQTSGLLVAAKNPKALVFLNENLKNKLIEKKYLAIVEGVVKDDFGKIEAPIGRYEDLKHWNVKSDGKHSETRFKVIERRVVTTLLELEPVTGRTNQLRIHCAYIGHPVLGDEWHGKRAFHRLCLHASKLKFWHPNGNEKMELESDLPNEIKTSG